MSRTNRDVAIILGTALGIEIFSEEYRVLTDLHEYGGVAYSVLEQSSPATRATFQRKLRNLKIIGLVNCQPSHLDRRVRTYSLTPQARQQLDTELAFLGSWPSSGNHLELDVFLERIASSLKTRVFSQEYTLLLGLFSHGQMYATELKHWSKLPHASFYAKINLLVTNGHVLDLGDELDHRRACLALTDRTRQLICDAHADLEAWAQRLPARL